MRSVLISATRKPISNPEPGQSCQVKVYDFPMCEKCIIVKPRRQTGTLRPFWVNGKQWFWKP